MSIGPDRDHRGLRADGAAQLLQTDGEHLDHAGGRADRRRQSRDRLIARLGIMFGGHIANRADENPFTVLGFHQGTGGDGQPQPSPVPMQDGRDEARGIGPEIGIAGCLGYRPGVGSG